MSVRLLSVTVAVLSALATPAAARTITLTDADCERMAFIHAAAPRWSWGGYDVGPGRQSTGSLYLYRDRAFLIAFPLEKIPKGQRIVAAELRFTTGLQPKIEQRLHLRRILASWGAGVCWRY